MNTFPAPLAATAEALRSGQLDLLTLIDEMCDRVEQIDGQVQALLPEPGRRERLRHAAAELQARFPDPAQRPPLYGVLLGVKDIIHADGFRTEAGTRVPPEELQGPEASCVAAARAAGALVLGKTVTTEFAYLEPGPTRNPHNLDHTPGGSSSGSAAAVAAGLCHLAFGTQTVGSVIRPAAFCGVVGYKPSFGRIPTDGVITFSESADHVGLFTQDVAGMQLAAAQLCRDWQDNVVTSEALPVLGVPEGPYLAQASAAGQTAFDAQIARLEQTGYTVQRIPALQNIVAVTQRHRQMIAAELAQQHAERFARHVALYRPLTAALIREGQAVPPDALAAAREERMVLRRELEALMAQTNIDMWVCPSAKGPAPFGIAATGGPAMNLPWTHAGLPTITIPAGVIDKHLPVGLQCIVPFGADERLLAWSKALAACF